MCFSQAFLNNPSLLFFMGLSIIAVGGYGEVGRNCTAVKVDDEVFLLDLGLHLDNYVRLQGRDSIPKKFSKGLLLRENAIPDVRLLSEVKDQVKGVLISHAHLDHVGAVPYLANDFNCDIHGTAFTIAVAKKLVEEKNPSCKNKLVEHEYRNIFPLTDNVRAEFIEVTHSTPQTAAIALHTPYGVVVYLNDFKLDTAPVMGNKTDLERLRALKPKVLILDTLYADVDDYTASETDAQHMLQETLLDPALEGKRILVSTFSSQIARLQELTDIADRMNRKIVFVGRSMGKYLEAAADAKVSDLIEKREVVRYSSKARKVLSKMHDPDRYLFVVTGGMGEPNAVLSRIIDEGYLPMRMGDVIVFSNRVIPTPSIVEDRARLEEKLKGKGFLLIKDRHVSGHGAGKDHQTILDTLRPEYVMPVHGEDKQRDAFKERALRSGVLPEKVVLLFDGETLLVS